MFRAVMSIFALLAGMVFLMIGGGLHGILLPVRGQIEGFSSFQLGWIGTGYAVGFTIGCILIPHLVRRAGHVRTFSTLTALLSVSMLGNALLVDAYLWAVLRAMSGFCFAGCYLVAESWLNERVSNDQRGSLFSIYAIVTLIAMGTGQYMLALAEPTKDTLFMLGAILYALAVVPTAVSKAQSPAPLTTVNLDVPGLIRNSPTAAVGAFASGILASAWTNFGPVFGQQVGMSATLIATLLVFSLVGSVLFQYPLGKLSDMIDRRYVMILAGIIGIGAGSLMTYLTGLDDFNAVFFLAVILYGGVIFCIYSLSVALANDYAESHEFVKISSGLLLIFGFGTMAGPLLTASMMDLFGPTGVFSTTTAAHVIIAVFALYRTFIRDRVDAEQRSDFHPVGLNRATTQETFANDPRSDADPFALTEEDELPPMPPPVIVEPRET